MPNIVLIVADDLGWKDVGFMGSSYYDTPNIDELAKQSMMFTNGYTAAANCAPSRACMISGQNTPRHGIYTVGTSERGDKEARKLIPTPNNEILADGFYTLEEALKDAGYYTGIIGKWHIGYDPLTQGFDYNVGGTHQGNAKSYFPPYGNPALTDGPKGEYITDRLGTEALTFIEKNKEKPFFLYLPHFAVHTPLQAQKEVIAKYKAKPKVPGQENAVYGAMVESLDLNVGRVLKKLDQLNLTDNTIVIFTSDNGGIRSISYQDPLRAGKGSYYEGGIRVPLLVRWPGKIKAGSSSDVPVTNMDFYPTILDILSLKNKTRLDGNSFWPVLQGKNMSKRSLYWHFPIYLQAYDPATDNGRDPVFRTRPGAVIRDGDWKLHVYYEDGAKELYNLKTDLGERNNVAAQNPRITNKLYKRLLKWQKDTHAPVPLKLNPDFDPAQQFVAKKKSKSED